MTLLIDWYLAIVEFFLHLFWFPFWLWCCCWGLSMLCRCFPASCLPRASCFCHHCGSLLASVPYTVLGTSLPSLLEFSLCSFSLGFSSLSIPPSPFLISFLLPSFLSLSQPVVSLILWLFFFLDFYCFGLCLVICDIVSPIPAFRRQRQALLILELCKFKTSMVCILNSRPPRTMY